MEADPGGLARTGAGADVHTGSVTTATVGTSPAHAGSWRQRAHQKAPKTCAVRGLGAGHAGHPDHQRREALILRLMAENKKQPLRELYAGIIAGVDIFAEAAADKRLKTCGLSERSTAALEDVQEALARLRAELAYDLLQSHDLAFVPVA